MNNQIEIIKAISSSDKPNLERPTSQPKLPQAPDPNLVKLLENKYKIEKCIGMGAQSYVYKAKRISDNSSVAIKQLRVNSVKDWKQYELFEREANVLQTLNVQGTAKFFEAIKSLDNEHPMSVIIQEYIDGRSLQYYINHHQRFSFDVACGILIQIIQLLDALHHQTPPVIHRDIKPSNIILKYDDDKYAQIPETFLIDFGAVANPQVQDGGSTITGTYGYMAPEQLVGQPTPASDIYAFAMLAFYLFSGVSPEKLQIQDLQPLIDSHLEHLPYSVTAFLRQMLDTNPLKRLTDYQAIQNTLKLFQNRCFDIEFNDKSYQTNAKIPYQINNVYTIGQKGNIRLWQELPNQTPRPILKSYQKMIEHDKRFWPFKSKTLDISYINFDAYQKEVYPQNAWFSHINTYNKRNRENTITENIYQNPINSEFNHDISNILNYIFIFVLLLLYMPLLVIYPSFGFLHVLTSLCLLVFLTLLVFFNCSYLIRFAIWNKTNPFKQIPKDYKLPTQKMKQFKKSLKNIFIYGRKSLATISKIEVIIPKAITKTDQQFETDPQYVKLLNFCPTTSLKIQDHIKKIVQDAIIKEQKQKKYLRPLWKVEYYFNPPDDDNPEPVHHTYYSEVPLPDLKIGDTLPILYEIQNKKVYSIPYPLPVNSSLMCCSNLVSRFSIKLTP